MRQILTVSLLFSTIRLATPLVWAAIGGLYSERSGVVNIALEGLMLAGAFTAAAVTFYMHSPWAGLGAAMLAGALFALLLAVACIRFPLAASGLARSLNASSLSDSPATMIVRES